MIRQAQIGNTSFISRVDSDKNGVLLSVCNDVIYDDDCFHVIYINGSQEDHYKANGYGALPLIMNERVWGHSCDFYGEGFKPYVFKYRINTGRDNSFNFSRSLLEAIKRLETDRIIIVGKSYGAIIACRLNESDLVRQIVCVNPCLLGSPLADINLFNSFAYGFSPLMQIVRLGQANVFKVEAGQTGFTREKVRGFEDDIRRPEKIQVIGGSINHLSPRLLHPDEIVLSASAKFILQATGLTSDGMTVFAKNIYEGLGLEVTELDRPYHNRAEHPDYCQHVFQKVIEKSK